MDVPAEVIKAFGDDKDLLAIEQAIRVKINEHLKDLEKRATAIEKMSLK